MKRRKPKLKRQSLQKASPKKREISAPDIQRLYTLLEEWTRYETAARLLPIECVACIDYYREMLDKEDEIRILLWGVSDLVKLADVLHLDIKRARNKSVYIRPTREGTPYRPDPARVAKRERLKAEHASKPYEAERERLGLPNRKKRGVDSIESTDDGMLDEEFQAFLAGIS